MTLNGTLTRLLYPFADKHAQINSRGFGDLSKFTASKEVHYPLMFVFLNNVSHPPGMKSFNFSIIFADLNKGDGELFQEIVSDMESVADDLCAYLRNHPSHDIDVTSNWVAVPFQDKSTDFTAGVSLDVSITVARGLNDCEIPLKN